MNYIRIIIPLLLIQSLLVLAERFDSIYSVHTERAPMCPPDFFADAEYIGCCWNESETITFAPGPDGSLSPGCCWSGDICTGPPPIMYDWIIDAEGDFSPILSPTLPATNPSASATKTTTSQSSSTSAPPVPTSSETFEPQPTETAPPTSTDTPKSTTRLSPAEIAGVVTGGLTVLLTAIGIWKYDLIKLLSQKLGKPSSGNSNSEIRRDIESSFPPEVRESHGSLHHENPDVKIQSNAGNYSYANCIIC
ncbi:hypothetical protein TWF281_009543 [Arthrobotrys megalospora]